MIGGRPLLPPVGDPLHALMRSAKAKNKTFLRRQTQDQVGASERLPSAGPESSKNRKKGDPTPAYFPARFQTHSSMRICFQGWSRVASSPDAYIADDYPPAPP